MLAQILSGQGNINHIGLCLSWDINDFDTEMPDELLLGGLGATVLELEGTVLLRGLEGLPGFGEVLRVEWPWGHVA
jgi:hypothetical protein